VKNRAFVFFILILILVDLVLHVGFGYGAGAPDLITAAALLSARRVSGAMASVVGLVLGLLADSMSIAAFGASAVGLVIVSYLGAWTRDMFEGNSTLFVAFYLFVGKWLRDIIVFLVAPSAHQGETLSVLWTAVPMHALVTAVCGAIALMIYRAVVGERRLR
jgi:rod shape-determining protein MreD